MRCPEGVNPETEGQDWSLYRSGFWKIASRVRKYSGY